MQKLLLLFMILFALTGCIRKMTIEQGNIMTPEMTNQLHTGMTQNEVRHILGSPLLLNTFRDNRVDYIYTFKPGGGTMTEHRITLIFKDDRLQDIIENNYVEKKK